MLTRYVAALLRCFVLLFGSQLLGQDQLLKEYIYLDGRLLAVERQSTSAAAQQPAIDKEKDLKANAAADWPVDGNLLFKPASSHEISFRYSEESSTDCAVFQQCPGAPVSSPACALE